MDKLEELKTLAKTSATSRKLNAERNKQEVQSAPILNVPEKSELDTLSFLEAEKLKATEDFNKRNVYHRKLLAEIEKLKDEADKARDEVLRAHGGMQRLDAMIEIAKGLQK